MASASRPAPAPASSGSSRRWNAAEQRRASGAADGASSGGASSSGGVVEHHEGVAGQVVEQHAAPPPRPRERERQHGSSSSGARSSAGWSGSKTAERLDLVAEELERAPAARGVGEKTSTMPPRTLHCPTSIDRLDALVAGRLERLEQRARARCSRRAQGEACARVKSAGGGSGCREPGGRGHDHHRLAGEQAPAAQRALRVGLAVPGAAPGAPAARGELEHPRVLPVVPARGGAARDRGDEEGGVLRHPVSRRRARREQEDRAAGALPQRGDHQGARGAPEPGGAQAGCSLGEGREELVERGPARQDGTGGHGHHGRQHIRGTTRDDPRRITGSPWRGRRRASPAR